MPKRQTSYDPLEEVDMILNDVREHLEHSTESGEIFELRALQLLLAVMKAMHSEHDPRRLVTMILDSAIAFAEAERAFLMLLDAEGTPRYKMGRAADQTYLGPDAFVISSTAVYAALESDKPLIIADTRENEAFNKRESIMSLKLRTVMAAPLRFQGQTLGLIYIDDRRPLTRYSTHHLNVLSSLAEQAAVAIVNAQKFDTHQGE